MTPNSIPETAHQPRNPIGRGRALLAAMSLAVGGLALAGATQLAQAPSASAVGDPYGCGGTADAAFSLTENGAQVVTNSAQLAALVWNDPAVSYLQKCDIDLTGIIWTPIGSQSVGARGAGPFQGIYDGDGRTISNLSVSRSLMSAGMFFQMDGATIMNLTLDHVTVSSTNYYVGALVGTLLSSTVSGVALSNAVINATGSNGSVVGGIAGYAGTDNGPVSISDVTVAETVQISATGYVGGLVGEASAFGAARFMSIDSITSRASVSAGADGYSGGLISYASSNDAATMTITNSAVIDAAITGAGQYVGGLVAWARHRGGSTFSIANTTVDGATVTGAGPNVGGLVGYTNPREGSMLSVGNVTVSGSTVTSTGENVGGLIGYALANTATLDLANMTVANSTVTGTGQDVGGLVGEILADDSTVTVFGSNVTNVAVTGADQVGGFMGLVSDDGANSPIIFAVSNSLVTGGSVVASAANPVIGGFIGRIDPDDAASTFTVSGSDAPAPNNCGTPGFIGSLGQPEQVTVTCPTPQAGNDDNSGAAVLPPALSDLVTRPVVSPTTTPPTTTPSTTVPAPVPATGGVLPELTPGASQVLIDGRPETVNVFVDNATDLVLSGDGFELRLAGQCTSACAITTDADGRQVLTLEREGLARVEGAGFKPGTPVYVWLFSEPTYLGEVTVNADGSFSGLVPLGDIAEGYHTLQVNGTSADGRPRTASLGVQVIPQQAPAPGGGELPATGANTTPLVLTALALLAMGFVATSRRRHLR